MVLAWVVVSEGPIKVTWAIYRMVVQKQSFIAKEANWLSLAPPYLQGTYMHARRAAYGAR
jgi:hypothetical protein